MIVKLTLPGGPTLDLDVPAYWPGASAAEYEATGEERAKADIVASDQYRAWAAAAVQLRGARQLRDGLKGKVRQLRQEHAAAQESPAATGYQRLTTLARQVREAETELADIEAAMKLLTVEEAKTRQTASGLTSNRMYRACAPALAEEREAVAPTVAAMAAALVGPLGDYMQASCRVEAAASAAFPNDSSARSGQHMERWLAETAPAEATPVNSIGLGLVG